MNWFVYILKCLDGSYYVGHTSNIDKRFVRHVTGHGAQHTATHPPEEIALKESFDTEQAAVAREHQLKRWSHAKKEALILGDVQRLRRLSRSND